jgi:Na+/glutamate symporter
MSDNEKKPKKDDIRQASTAIAICSIIGLVACFGIASFRKIDVPIFIYAIFGGGILGTESVIKLVRTIFRIGGDK